MAKKALTALIPNYSQAAKVGATLYVSGILATKPGSGDLVTGGIEHQTRQTLENLKEVLHRHGFKLEDVAKTTCYLHDLSDYAKFNQVYAEHFRQPYPSRATVGGLDLVLGGLVEIECVAFVGWKASDSLDASGGVE